MKLKRVFCRLLLIVFCLATSAAQPQVAYLKMHLKLDEGSGGAATDSSGNGNSGSLFPPSPDGPAWTPGHFGGALEFDGANDGVNVGTSDFGVSSEITVAFWMYAVDGGAESQTLIARNQYAYPFFIQLLKSTGKLRACVRTFSGTSYLISNAVFQPNVWRHFALTYKSGAQAMYVDGVLNSTSTVAGDLRSRASATTLGTNGSGQFFRGRLDDVRVYNSALGAQEIRSLFAGDSPPTIPQEVAAVIHGAGVALSWKASADDLGVAGYRIYRCETAIGTTVDTYYEDVGLEQVTSRTYQVSAFDAVGNESKLSLPVLAVMPKIYQRFINVGEQIRIAPKSGSKLMLSWSRNSESDLDGYNVYKGGNVGGLTKMNGPLIKDSFYVDDEVSSATAPTYYAATAVDTSGNESERSVILWAIGRTD